MNKYIEYLQPILQKKSGNRIILFGAGEIGKRVYVELENMKIQDAVPFFIDNSINLQKKGILGCKVYSIEQAKKKICETDLVLITSSYYQEIKELLQKSGFSRILRCDNLWYLSFYYDFEGKSRVDDLVEFYLIDSFEIYHFYPIYKYLQENGIKVRMIAETPKINTSYGDWFDYETTVTILNEIHIEYSVKCNPYAKWAITTQEATVLQKYQNIKINMVYGASLLKKNYFLSKRSADGFDYKFVHSNMAKNIMTSYMPNNRVYIMGYPKHIGFFKQIHDKNKILNELMIKTDKPVLVYLPTWDEFSSITVFADKIEKLKDKYYIICKMHHCTAKLKEKEGDRNILYQLCDKILLGNFDLEKVAIIADAVIADAKSGVATEISYLNSEIPNVLLWPFPIDEINDDFNEDLNDFAPVSTGEADLKEMLEVSVQYKNRRKKIVRKYYGEQGKNNLKNLLTIFE